MRKKPKKPKKILQKFQQKFYENNASFVICELQKPVEKFLEEKELLDLMNITPTESEAWDIVQMEEIEREFFDEDEKSPGWFLWTRQLNC